MRLVRNETERIDLGDGAWVEVKRALSVGERARLAGRAFAVRASFSAGAATDINLGDVYEQMELAGLEIGIVAWSLPDPVTPENVRALDEESAKTIKARIDVLWAARTDEEKKDSASSGLTPSAASDATSPASSDGS